MDTCKRMIGEKGKLVPCGLPVREEGLCVYHAISKDALESRWARGVLSGRVKVPRANFGPK